MPAHAWGTCVSSCEAAHALQSTEGFNVPGLTMAEVRSMSEVEKLLRFGAANRTVSSTRMNQHSSRSHQVLTVYLTSRDKRTGAHTFPVWLRWMPASLVYGCPLLKYVTCRPAPFRLSSHARALSEQAPKSHHVLPQRPTSLPVTWMTAEAAAAPAALQERWRTGSCT